MVATASGYRTRIVDDELDELLPGLPAIALEGAKAVGKTETARRRAHTVHALDQPGVMELVRSNPYRVITGTPPILIDEWQRMPASWDLVRRAVDDDRRPGRFLLAGSASPHDPGTHSGAGRIVRLRMRPLSLAERGVCDPAVSLADLLTGVRPPIEGRTQLTVEDYTEEICASGFPGLRGTPRRALRAELDGYIDRIVDRDFAEMGRVVRSPATLRRWMSAYAAATATTTAYDAIRDAATPGEREKPSKTTTRPYRDILERLWILDPLPAWLPTRNHLRRLGAAPKHHLADPALAARLLGLDAGALLNDNADRDGARAGSAMLGHLFESLVVLGIRTYAQPAETSVGHLRTHRGEHEIDVIVRRPDDRVVAIEVKLSYVIEDRDVRHLHWLRDRLGDDLLDAVVVTTGPEAYRRPDGIAVVPAALLGP